MFKTRPDSRVVFGQLQQKRNKFENYPCLRRKNLRTRTASVSLSHIKTLI